MWYKNILFISLLFFTSSCGYHFVTKSSISSTLSIPYIEGDLDGELTNIVIQKITALGYSILSSENSDFIIQARIKSDRVDPIGFQFDPNCKENKRVITNENRRTLLLEFSILSTKTKEKFLGPYFIKESIDYDFQDDYPCQDSTVNQQSYLNFSLGQLDNREAAFSASANPLFHKTANRMAETIFSALMYSSVTTLDKIK